MGVYGYGTAGMAVPEGYLDIKVTVNGVRSARCKFHIRPTPVASTT
jgi:hypothetical protein